MSFSDSTPPETVRPMKSSEFCTSSCRRCRHYSPEGRRGGHCQQLNVPVQGSWRACPLAMPIFQQPAWSFQKLALWQPEEPQSIPIPVAVEATEVTASSI